MKSMKRSMWAGTVAVALLLGGFGGMATQPAYADDDDDTIVAAPAPIDTSIPLKKRIQLDWSQVESNAATVLNMDWIDLQDALAGGSSILEAAAAKGVSGETLTSQLVQMESAKVTEALQSNKITQAEADKLNQQIADKISKIINKEGYQNKAKSSGDKSKKLQLHYKPKAADLAKLLGIDKDELKKELSDGKSVADIAAVKGITEEQLMAKLSDELKPTLESLIHQTEK